MTKPILKFNDVSLLIRGKPLIKDMCFELKAKTRTTILGPNGAGKSLLLRLSHNLLNPTSGHIEWNDAERPLRQAMIFQKPVMLRRSVRENVDIALNIKGIGKKERLERVQEMLSRVGLGRLHDVPAKRLSGGEQQRLALARAWILKPDILLLDEPTSNLDPSSVHAFEEIVHRICEEGTKIMLTTHDLGQARRLSDDILFLHRGRLKEQSDAKTFFAGPQNDLAQAYLNSDLLWWKRKEANPKKRKYY